MNSFLDISFASLFVSLFSCCSSQAKNFFGNSRYLSLGFKSRINPPINVNHCLSAQSLSHKRLV